MGKEKRVESKLLLLRGESYMGYILALAVTFGVVAYFISGKIVNKKKK